MALDVEREPLEVSDFPANLQKHVDPDAPAKMKLMGAQGMVPAPPEQTVRMLYQLHFDDSSQIQQEVDQAVSEMPENVVENVVEKEDHPGVLDWVADKCGDAQPIVEALLRNQATEDLTVARLAKSADTDACEVIATNEVRILRTPQIIEELYQNPNARMATVDGLIELAQRNDVELRNLPGVQRALKAQEDLSGEEADERLSDQEFEEMLEAEHEHGEIEDEKLEKLEDEDLTRSEKEKLREEIEEGIDDVDEKGEGEEEEESDDKRMLTPGDLQQMTIPQKIRLATCGSRAAIKKLVQDPNRLVHMAAIESPRLKQPDAVRLAGQKSVPDGVISYIANNREWTQNYQVVKNLAFNPKTPVSDTMDLLKRLRNNDLKKLQGSREVPHQVTRAAKRLYQKRTGRG